MTPRFDRLSTNGVCPLREVMGMRNGENRVADPLDIPWQPCATLIAIQKRADLLMAIRAFFQALCIMEVDTPLLSRAGTTDPALESFRVPLTPPGEAGTRDYFLQTSPEFAMKRLLAAGVGACYQICKVFRAEEVGRQHNPEFTMLEWYRLGFNHLRLMDEVEALVCSVLRAPPALRQTYGAAFELCLGLDPHRATMDALLAAARALPGTDPCLGTVGAAAPSPASRGYLLDLLFSHGVAPHLGKDRPLFLYDYPAEHSALSRLRDEDDGVQVAERFELFVAGVELANGYHELVHAAEQRARFTHDLDVRALRGQAAVPMDERLLAAMGAGLPACSGVAIGVDRLLMLSLGVKDLAATLAFPFPRA